MKINHCEDILTDYGMKIDCSGCSVVATFYVHSPLGDIEVPIDIPDKDVKKLREELDAWTARQYMRSRDE